MEDYLGVFALLEAFVLSESGINSKKIPKVTAQENTIPVGRGHSKTHPEFVGPKSSRGRPKKLALYQRKGLFYLSYAKSSQARGCGALRFLRALFPNTLSKS